MALIKSGDLSKIVTLIDHIAPARSIDDANDKSFTRQFIDEQGIETIYGVGTGISYKVLYENGHIRPGAVILDIDSYTVFHDVFGATGTSIGVTIYRTCSLLDTRGFEYQKQFSSILKVTSPSIFLRKI